MISLEMILANITGLDKLINADILIVMSTVFGLGFLSGLSPCGLPTVVLVSSYVSKKSDKDKKFHSFLLSAAFVLGIILVLAIIGGISGFMGSLLQKGQTFFAKGTFTLKLFVAIVSAGFFILGLWMMKVIKWGGGNNPMAKMKVKKGSGVKGAFLFGLPFGIAASPCTTPITIAVLMYLAAVGNIFTGMFLMALYALARSLPILLVGSFAGLLIKFKKIEKAQTIIEKVGGVIMILVGVYFFLKSILYFDIIVKIGKLFS